MSDALNIHQFTSLDYADADMYGALLERPTTATPLQLPLGKLVDKDTKGALSPGELAHYRGEEQRRKTLFREQNEAQTARENALREREIARNRLLLQTKTPEEVPAVSARDYEKKFKPPTPIEEWQGVPSKAAPPPTPSGTAARADSLVEPTATPRPAILREAIGNTVGGIGQSLPKSLPQAAGRLVIPGVGAGLTFASALIAGQSVQQATITTVFVTGGGIAGTIIGTAVAGPIGGYIGTMVGGFIGGQLGNALFPQQMPSTAVKQVEQTPRYVPFSGGQNPGALYYVLIAYPGENSSVSYSRSAPILGVITGLLTVKGSDGVWTSAIYYNGGTSLSDASRNGSNASPFISSIYRVDGANDYPPPGAGSELPPQSNYPAQYNAPSPIGNDNTVPSGTPMTGQNKGEARNVAPSMPSNNTPNGAPFYPGHGGLAPSFLPNPEHQPSNLGGMLPQMQPLPQRQPLPFAEPEDVAVPRIAPLSSGQSTTTATNPSTFAYPAYVPETAKPIPISDALSPVPKSKSAPITKTPTELSNDAIKTALDQQKKDFDDQIGRITAIATAIAALTPAIQGIPKAIADSPAVNDANKATVQGAVCEISQPTGCLGAPIKQAEDAAKANGSKLDALNLAGQGADLALLGVINTKLGDQVPGGISGFMNRIVKSQWVDRAVNLITMTAAVHNVIMLSDQAATTFFGILDNVLAIPKLIIDPNAETIDTKEAFGGLIDGFFKSIFGVTEWAEIKKKWQTANRIYQAAANAANEIRGIGGNIISAVEQTARLTGKGFNAMQDEGLLSEANWDYSPENLKLKGGMYAKFGKLADGINIATEGLEAIESITSEIRSAVDSANQIKENAKEIDDGVKELTLASKTKREEEVAALPAKSYSWEDLI